MKKIIIIFLITLFVFFIFILLFNFLQKMAISKPCNQPTEEQFALNNDLVEIATSTIGKFYSKGNKVYKIVTGMPCGINLQETIFNSKTFIKLNDNYFENNNKIYYNEYLVEDADSKTFKTFDIHPSFAKDKSNIFYRGKILEDVDFKTFELLTRLDSFLLAKDKNMVYKFGINIIRIENVDAETFEAILNDEGGPTWYYKDKNNVYTVAESSASKSIGITPLNISPNNVYVDKNGRLYKK